MLARSGLSRNRHVGSVGPDVRPDGEGVTLTGPPSIARDPFEGVAPGTPGGATTEPAQPGAPNVVVQPVPRPVYVTRVWRHGHDHHHGEPCGWERHAYRGRGGYVVYEGRD